jgi:hypothetical protein
MIPYDANTALIVVDVQNDFADPQGTLSVHGAEAIIPAINAENALSQIGWLPRLPLADEQRAFDTVFPFPPRPLQQAMIDALAVIDRPAILLVEAPMGEGKEIYADDSPRQWEAVTAGSVAEQLWTIACK